MRRLAKWIEEGGKPTKYFLALEKRITYIKEYPNSKIVQYQTNNRYFKKFKKIHHTICSNKYNELCYVNLEDIFDKH